MIFNDIHIGFFALLLRVALRWALQFFVAAVPEAAAAWGRLKLQLLGGDGEVLARGNTSIQGPGCCRWVQEPVPWTKRNCLWAAMAGKCHNSWISYDFINHRHLKRAHFPGSTTPHGITAGRASTSFFKASSLIKTAVVASNGASWTAEKSCGPRPIRWTFEKLRMVIWGLPDSSGFFWGWTSGEIVVRYG